jgi:hypothetical protein
MNRSLLLPREKYIEASQRWGKSPIMMEIENDKQSLFYFGANHSRELKNHQFPILKEYWEKFLNKTKDKERIILLEGGLRPLAESSEVAIRDNSEGGYITFISNGTDTPIVSPDIKDSDLLNQLPEISKEEFLLYRFISLVDSYHRFSDPKPDFNIFFENWASYQKTRGFWHGMDISIDHLEELYKDVMGKDFNLGENQNGYVNPNNIGSRINEIARKTSDVRDENILNEIVKYWSEGKSVFVVFGSGHLIIQEPALREILK